MMRGLWGIFHKDKFSVKSKNERNASMYTSAETEVIYIYAILLRLGLFKRLEGISLKSIKALRDQFSLASFITLIYITILKHTPVWI